MRDAENDATDCYDGKAGVDHGPDDLVQVHRPSLRPDPWEGHVHHGHVQLAQGLDHSLVIVDCKEDKPATWWDRVSRFGLVVCKALGW